MASIGITAGAVDAQSIADQLSSIDKIPVTKIAEKVSALGLKQTALSTLKTVISSFDASARAIGDPLTRASLGATVTSSDPISITASVSGAVTSGVHQISVSQLAQSQRLSSSPFSSTGAALNADTLSFDVGQWSGGSFTPSSTNATATVSIAAGDTVSTVVDKINASSVPVRASLVNNGTNGYQIIFTAKDSGLQSQVKISSTSNPSIAYDGTAGGLTQMQGGQDAKIVVDGLPITRSTNTISDAIPGASFTIGSVTTKDVNLSVGRDDTKIKAALTAFATAFSTVISESKRLSPTGAGNTGPLSGESIVRQASSSIKQAMMTDSSSGSVKSFSELGLQFQKDGSISLDAVAFDKKYKADPQGVMDFFSGSAMSGVLTATSSLLSATGPLAGRSSGISKEVQSLNSKKLDLDAKVTKKRDAYVKQYTALNVAIQKIQTGGAAMLASVTNI